MPQIPRTLQIVVSSMPVEEARHSWKSTNDNTDSIAQGRCRDKLDQSLMQISHVSIMYLLAGRREPSFLELP